MSGHITFIAGIPGSGKTALLIDLLQRECIAQNRPVFIDWRLNPVTNTEGPSIPELGIPHSIIPDARKWHEDGVLPDGAVLVIDEAQDVWPAAPAGSKLGPDLLAMNRIRHRGISLYFTSQRPAMIHAHVRGLVGRYILLRDLGLLGRRWHEWPEFPEHPLAFKSAISTKSYKLPKHVFGLYKSASVHVKRQLFVPRAVIMLGVALVALVGLCFYAWQSISKKTERAKKPAIEAPGGSPPGMVAKPPQTGVGGPSPRVLAVGPMVKDREPYGGFGVHVSGSVEAEGRVTTWFSVSHNGRVVATLVDRQLFAAGYTWRAVGPCSGVLRFGDLERAVTCDAPAAARPGPALAASAPSA